MSENKKHAAELNALISKLAESKSVTNMLSQRHGAHSEESLFFRRLEAFKCMQEEFTYKYDGSSVAECAEWSKRRLEDNQAMNFVSKAMVMAYAAEHGYDGEFFKDSATQEYATAVAQKGAESAGIEGNYG